MVRSARRVAALGVAVFVLGLVSVGITAASTTPQAVVLDSASNGIVDNNSIHGIIIVNGYSDLSARVTVSLHGLNRANHYRVVGSTSSCSTPNTDRATIFGIVIVNGRDPFITARKTGIHDMLGGLVSLRVLETSPAARQVGCVAATNLVAR